MIRWIPGRTFSKKAIDLDSLSYQALAAVMNALNPSPHDFACEGDRKAFSDVSVEVSQRWYAKNSTSSFGLS